MRSPISGRVAKRNDSFRRGGRLNIGTSVEVPPYRYVAISSDRERHDRRKAVHHSRELVSRT
jgi:hypothetical protein